MKTLGAVLIILSSGSVGIKIAFQLKQRCELLREFIRCLRLLHNELSCYGTPLPQAFGLLASSAEPPLETVFSNIAKQMQQKRWLMPKDAMDLALKQCSLPMVDGILCNLAETLGKYDLQAQLSGVEFAEKETAELLKVMEEERSLRSKTYRTLGICAGIAAVILLI